MIKKVKNKLNRLNDHALEVAKKSFSSTIVKVVGMIFSLGISIFLGRTIGVDGLGIINLSNRIINLMIVLSLFGFRQVIIKEVAIAYIGKNWKRVGDVMHSSYIITGLASTIITLIMIIASPWLIENVFQEPRLKWPLIVAFIAMTPQVFSRNFSSALIGYKKIWQSNLVEQTLSLGIVTIALFLIWFSGKQITVLNTALSYAIGRFFVMLIIGIYWRKLFHSKEKKTFIPKQLLKVAKPLLLVSITFVIASNSDIIMLGWLGDSKMVGFYSVAVRIALLTSFFLQITNAAISPKIASLFEEKKFIELEEMIQTVTKGLLIIAIATLFIFIVFGKQILGIWGPEFQSAYWILIILSIGQFFNIGTGASGLVLIMCGLEKTHAWISTCFVFINLILNFFLIKYWGALGAAVATSITVTFDNLSRVIIAKIKLKIWTIPLVIKNKNII